MTRRWRIVARLRDLGRQYNVPVWMTEVSHGGLDPRTMDALRARAIEIHDELAYADASAFFAMHAHVGQQVEQRALSAPGGRCCKEEDTIVLIDLDAGIGADHGDGLRDRALCALGAAWRGACRGDESMIRW